MVVPTIRSALPDCLASMVRHLAASLTMARALMSMVGGMVMRRPSSVVNWLLSESLPLTKGASKAIAPS